MHLSIFYLPLCLDRSTHIISHVLKYMHGHTEAEAPFEQGMQGLPLMTELTLRKKRKAQKALGSALQEMQEKPRGHPLGITVLGSSTTVPGSSGSPGCLGDELRCLVVGGEDLLVESRGVLVLRALQAEGLDGCMSMRFRCGPLVSRAAIFSTGTHLSCRPPLLQDPDQRKSGRLPLGASNGR